MISFFRKHVWILVVLVSILVIPQALSTQSELNIRVLITCVAIDKAEQGYKVTTMVVIPKGGGSGQNAQEELEFVSAEAFSVSEALEIIAVKIGKTLAVGHLDSILVGESMLSSDNLAAELDYLTRNDRISNTVPIFCCKGDAGEIIKKTKGLDISTSIVLQKIFLHKQSSSSGILLPLYEFVNHGFTKSRTAMVSGFEIEEEAESKGSGGDSGGESGLQSEGTVGNGGGSEGSSVGSADEKVRIKYYNEIYYFKDNKFVDTIKENDQLNGVYLMNPKSKEMLLSLTGVDGNELFKDASVALQLREKKLKLKPSFENGVPTVKIKISFSNNNVNEIISKNQNNEHYYILKTYLTKTVKDAASKKIEEDIMMVFDETKNKADIFQIEDLFYKYTLREYKEYKERCGDDFLRDVQLQFDIKVDMRM